MKSFENFNEYIQEAVKSYWHDSSLSDYEGSTLQYKDVACLIEKLHILYEKANIKPGDKIALCGRNSAHWAVAFMSILSYGAVAVPILNDFKANQIHDIVNHSEAKLLFAGETISKELDVTQMPHLNGIFSLLDFSIIHTRNLQMSKA